jgi:integrase
MPRHKNNAPVDLGRAQDLTFGLIDRLACPVGRHQVFLRDAKAPGLRVRVTAAGAKSFVFEAKLDGQTIRSTIGSVKTWSIEAARAEANRLRVTLDRGDDPRELARQRDAAKAAERAAAAAQAETELKEIAAGKLTVRQAWDDYLNARRQYWGDHNYNDHVKLSRAGGKPATRGTRGKGKTIDMPLHSLMGLPLRSLDTVTIEAWAAREAKTRPASARLAWRLLKVFLNWCSEQPEYAGLLTSANPAKTKKAREVLGKPGVKRDVLLREQLSAWFAAVRNISNPVTAAYLQVALLTGARPNEILNLSWDDVNTKWHGLTIRDKVEGERQIPLTPYVEQLLVAIPRRNRWVFSSGRVLVMSPKNERRRAAYHAKRGTVPPIGTIGNSSASGRLIEPSIAHRAACAVAGIEQLTRNGLRRSFRSLTEWLDIPAGVIAQIMGHKPSAIAEKHYTIRPLDLLRIHHERVEAWILEQAGVHFVPRV